MTDRPAAVILAGGLARRLGGGDKVLRRVGDRVLMDLLLERLGAQASPVVLNANGDPERFASWRLPVVADPIHGNPGPLAGVLAGMLWARAGAPDAADILSVPSDTPFLPVDLVARLVAARAGQPGARIALAASGGRTHPVVGLWPVELADDLARALDAGIRKVETWAAGHGIATAAFAAEPSDPFFNVNHPDDLQRAEAMLRQGA